MGDAGVAGFRDLVSEIEKEDTSRAVEKLHSAETARIVLGCLNREDFVEVPEIVRVLEWAAEARRRLTVLKLVRALDQAKEEGTKPLYRLRWNSKTNEPEIMLTCDRTITDPEGNSHEVKADRQDWRTIDG